MSDEKSKFTIAEVVVIIISFLSLILSIGTILEQKDQFRKDKAPVITLSEKKIIIESVPKFSIDMKNIGESQATNLIYDFDFWILDKPISQTYFDSIDRPKHGFWLFQNESLTHQDTLQWSLSELEELIGNKKKKLYLVCWLSYEDRFDEVFEMKHIYKVKYPEWVFEPCGGMFLSAVKYN
jgi:hypothetical protein